MNVKNRALIIVSFVIVMMTAIYLYDGISHFNDEIDLVILNVTNKLDRVEDAGSILAGAASEMSYDSKELSSQALWVRL